MSDGTVQKKCSKCGRVLRIYKQGEKDFVYGSPLITCPGCKTEIYDKAFHEMALEGKPEPVPEPQKPALDNTQNRKKKKWFGKAKEEPAEEIQQPREPLPDEKTEQLYRESAERIKDYQYVMKLAAGSYIQDNPSAEKAIHDIIREHTQSYLDLLDKRVGEPFRQFRVNNAEKYLFQLDYEEHDEAAVREVVRQVLGHYGLDFQKYDIEIEYKKDSESEKKGTLGTFFPRGINGGVIRIVLPQYYSHYDSVVAVILHECAHAFLHTRMIDLDDSSEKERLTDVAAIYLGGGDYLYRGYYAFRHFQIGYLKKEECIVLREEIKEKRKEPDRREKEEFSKTLSEWKKQSAAYAKMVTEIPKLMGAIHPDKVIREKVAGMGFYLAYRYWSEKQDFYERLVRQIQSHANPGLYQMQKDLETMKKHGSELTSYYAVAREWDEAQRYQEGIPEERKALAKGLQPLLEESVSAKLEMIRFWSECPATVGDAESMLRELREMEEDPEALCAAGICLLEGIACPKDAAEGKALLDRAASLRAEKHTPA